MTDTQMVPSITLSGARGVGRSVRGPALVSQQNFGVRYDLDPERGIISNPNHDLFGQKLAGRVVFFSKPKGGIAASWALAALARRDLAPLGIVFRLASPIFVQGAIFADLPIVDQLETAPQDIVKTGDVVELNPSVGTVAIFR